MNPCLSRGSVSPLTESGIKLFWKPRGKLKVKLGKKTMDFSWFCSGRTAITLIICGCNLQLSNIVAAI